MLLGNTYVNLRQRFFDVLASVYIYNEYTGYVELEHFIAALRDKYPEEEQFLRDVQKHCDDERKHYLMFRNYFKKAGRMPFQITATYGYVDLFIDHIFKQPIEGLVKEEILADDRLFFKLCRLIMMTEFRGMKQVHTLLKNPLIQNHKTLRKIFKVIERDEPSHCYPYQYWLKTRGGAEPGFQEKVTDLWIHYSLMLIKIPFLFVNPRVKRMQAFYDEQTLAVAHG